MAGPGAEGEGRRHPPPLPHAWAHLQLLAPVVTASLPQLREQSQAVFTCPSRDHKAGGWEQSHHPTPPGHRLCLCPNLPLGRREAARPAHPATELTPDQPLGGQGGPQGQGPGAVAKGQGYSSSSTHNSSAFPTLKKMKILSHPHSTDGETEAWRHQFSCPSPPRGWRRSWNKTRQPDSSVLERSTIWVPRETLGRRGQSDPRLTKFSLAPLHARPRRRLQGP